MTQKASRSHSSGLLPLPGNRQAPAEVSRTSSSGGVAVVAKRTLSAPGSSGVSSRLSTAKTVSSDSVTSTFSVEQSPHYSSEEFLTSCALHEFVCCSDVREFVLNFPYAKDSDGIEAAKAMLFYYEKGRQLDDGLQFIKQAIDLDIASCRDGTSVLRNSSSKLTLIGFHASSQLKPLLDRLISTSDEELSDTSSSPFRPRFKGSKTKLTDNEMSDAEVTQVVSVVDAMLDAIEDYVSSEFPEPVRQTLRYLRAAADRKFPDGGLTCVRAYLFLVAINPVLVPSQDTSEKKKKGSPTKDKLIRPVMRFMQRAANQTFFRDEKLASLNPLLAERQKRIDEICDLALSGESVLTSSEEEDQEEALQQKAAALLSTLNFFSIHRKELARKCKNLRTLLLLNIALEIPNSENIAVEHPEFQPVPLTDKQFRAPWLLGKTIFTGKHPKGWDNWDTHLWVKALGLEEEVYPLEGLTLLDLLNPSPWKALSLLRKEKFLIEAWKEDRMGDLSNSLRSIGVSSWTTWHVALWLVATGKERCTPCFVANEVNGRALMAALAQSAIMTKLKNIGSTKATHPLALLEKIYSLEKHGTSFDLLNNISLFGLLEMLPFLQREAPLVEAWKDDRMGDLSNSLRSIGVSSWTTWHVVLWLVAIGQEEYSPHFVAKKVNGKTLSTMATQEQSLIMKGLEYIGVTSLGHRIRIARAVQSLGMAGTY